MTKLTGAALDRAVANAMGLKRVNNCEQWRTSMTQEKALKLAQEPPQYAFKAYWEADGRIGVVACIERPDGGMHLMNEILDLPPSTEPQYTPEHQARIAAFKEAMHITKEKKT